MSDYMPEWVYDIRKELEKLAGVVIPESFRVPGEENKTAGIDAFYNARWTWEGSGSKPEPHPSDIWSDDSFTTPKDYSFVSLYSKVAPRYPKMISRAILPDFSDVYRGRLWFCGFEGGGGRGLGGAMLQYNEPDDMLLTVGGGYPIKTDLEVSSLVPTDAHSTRYSYTVKINKGTVECRIAGDLVAVAGVGAEDSVLYDNTSPYAVGVVRGLPAYVNTLAELYYEDPEGEFPEFTADVPPQKYRWRHGNPTPARSYDLYKESSTTKWEGLSTGGTVQTSHPVPIAGYPNKTVYFKSDAGGTLDIEIYVGGGWKVYDTVTVTANELETYLLSGQAPLMRCVYTPTDDDTINLAEVNLA